MTDTQPAPAADNAGTEVAIQHADTARQYLGEVPRGGHIDDDAADYLNTARRSVERALDSAQLATRNARQIQDDDTIYPEGRQRKVRETVTEAQQEVEHHLDRAEVMAKLAEAGYTQAAKIKVPRGESATARQDARMLLDGAHERGELESAVERLAARQDVVGGLVSSQWLTDYLTSLGTPEDQVRAMRAVADRAALDGALTAGGDRAKAAERALAMRKGGAIHKARISALHATHNALHAFLPEGVD